MKDDSGGVEREIRRRFLAFFTHAEEELGPALRDLFSIEFGGMDQAKLVVYSLTRKSIKSFEAVTVLASKGFGEDAMLVARSMAESATHTVLLARCPRLAAKYIDFRWIREYRLLLELSELDRDYADSIFDEERTATARTHFEELHTRFGIKKDRPFGGNWHKASIARLAKTLASPEYPLKDLYVHVYGLGSDISHGVITDVMTRTIVTESGTTIISSEPSEHLVAAALAGSHLALLVSIRTCDRVMGLGRGDLVDKLVGRHNELWHPENL